MAGGPFQQNDYHNSDPNQVMKHNIQSAIGSERFSGGMPLALCFCRRMKTKINHLLGAVLSLLAIGFQVNAQAAEIAQEAYLKSSNTGNGHFFGHSVAISGDTAVVGPNQEAGGGAVYVFVRTATGWSHQARLTGFNTEGGTLSVSL